MGPGDPLGGLRIPLQASEVHRSDAAEAEGDAAGLDDLKRSFRSCLISRKRPQQEVELLRLLNQLCGVKTLIDAGFEVFPFLLGFFRVVELQHVFRSPSFSLSDGLL